MQDEKQTRNEMISDPAIRKDLFSMKRTTQATGVSRAMLIRLENAGFITPHTVNHETGYRYYDTFNVHKVLEYKRLRLMGLSQADIFDYCSAADDVKLKDILRTLRKQEMLLKQEIEFLSLRVEKTRQRSFSFYDYEAALCLIKEGDFVNPLDMMTFAYNGSVEIISRGLKPSATQHIMTLRYDTKTKKSGDPEKPFHIKLCFPIERDIPKGADLTDIEEVPACHTLSILSYGLSNADESRDLLWQKIEELHLTPLSDEMRSESILAPYVNMQATPDDYVSRFSVPVKENS